MKLQDIKTKLNIPTFNLNFTVDQATKEKTEWLRHWDNENRVAVNIHQDTLAKAKADPTLTSYGLKEELGVMAAQGTYDRYTIVLYNPSDETL